MSDFPKKFKFEDLQPHVEMLCDALENRGASSSGFSHTKEVYEFANRYREILRKVRENKIGITELWNDLRLMGEDCIKATGENQKHRIAKIVNALDFFIKKEYSKYRS